MFDTSKAIRNRFDDLAEKALEGNSVSIYLRPIESAEDKTGLGAYIESVQLPHLIVRDQMVWAGQDRNVQGGGRCISFSYGWLSLLQRY